MTMPWVGLAAVLLRSVAIAFSPAVPIPYMPVMSRQPLRSTGACRVEPRREVAPSSSWALLASSAEQDSEPNVDEIYASADAIFGMVDTDGDGTISYTELQSHLIDVCGYSQDAVDSMYYALDGDLDGVISREELRMGFVRYESLRNAPGMGRSSDDADEGTIRRDAAAMFGSIDKDGSGRIDDDELRTFLRSRGYSDNAIDSIYATLDVDSDGQISREELTDAFVQYSALRYAAGTEDEIDPSSEFQL